MAKLTDLPAEPVHRIIHYLHYPDPQPLPHGYQRSKPRDEHHLLDHTEINSSLKPLPRPHEERYIDRGPNYPIPYSDKVTWPGGRPNNPCLPLALINQTFRLCAQERLFKNVTFENTWTASLFLKSLISISHEDASSHKRQPIDTQVEQYNPHPRLNCLSQYVRSLQFDWGDKCSMRKGGGSMFCKILEICPLLEDIAISSTFLLACKEPILQALASTRHIKEILILKNASGQNSTFRWQAHEVVTRLFSQLNSLKTVELSDLSSWPTQSSYKPALHSSLPMPKLNCAIRTMVLKDHDLDELTLSNLLKSCGDSMRTLKLTGPGHRLDRAAFGRVLQGSTSRNLECLIMLQSSGFQQPPYFSSDDLGSDDPLTTPGLLDIVFSSPTALRKLKTLSFYGRHMATDRLFARLPKSLVKLSWERSRISASPLLQALSSSRDQEASLPNLKCCSVLLCHAWDAKDERAIEQALKKRGGWFHPLVDPAYGSPSSTTHGDDDYSYDPYEHQDWYQEYLVTGTY
ncbi:hypothetical protein PCASD_02954 [Puccinia coronata f. sp. avenae]|uniref:Uncharacterized protein n=1 Tax=Puccinia coronata f. sp. avenae TaxID=200324 RepID=A0A2N5VEB8_9BASI|nr:hypothetical protein PCASD_02954 [Puccinia coronata f. sp. avenae]